MHKQKLQDGILLTCVTVLFAWFFASSLSIAWHRAPSNDDAMFATVTKNFLRGEGWATNYGEKIPFNPDLTAGPVLLLSAAPLMLAADNAPWVPAVSGAIVNILLCFLILRQVYMRWGHRIPVYLALLLSISLFAVNDFKTFTGYYSSALLFLFAVLLITNEKYSPRSRLLTFGVLMGLGLYTKPLILLSFLAVAPLCVFWLKHKYLYPITRAGIWMLAGCLLVFVPWHIYKNQALADKSPGFRESYRQYQTFFFEHHGSGVAQYKAAPDKLRYLEKNTLKNSRILNRFLENHLGITFFWFLFFIAVVFAWLAVPFLRNRKTVLAPEFLLIVSVVVNLLWFLVFSFALTPGHAFFAVFFSIFLLFYLTACHFPSSTFAGVLCIVLALVFVPAHKPLAGAYSFRQDDPVFLQEELHNMARLLDERYSTERLASCGYAGAPWRLIYLRESSSMIHDCYHLLEDALRRGDDGSYHWTSIPDFVLVMEGAGLLASVRSQGYVLEPLLQLCASNMLHEIGSLRLCRIKGDALVKQLDPARTALELLKYQGWYRTRLER